MKKFILALAMLIAAMSIAYAASPVTVVGFNVNADKLSRGQNLQLSVPVHSDIALSRGNVRLQIYDSNGTIVKDSIINFTKLAAGGTFTATVDFVPGNTNSIGKYGAGVIFYSPDLTTAQGMPYTGKNNLFEVVNTGPALSGEFINASDITVSATTVARGDKVAYSANVTATKLLPSAGSITLEITDVKSKVIATKSVTFKNLQAGVALKIDNVFTVPADLPLGQYYIIFRGWSPELNFWKAKRDAFVVAAEKPKPVDGVCGAAKGVAVSIAPTANLCAMGVAGAVTLSGTNFVWGCDGSNGGALASCVAAKIVPLVLPDSVFYSKGSFGAYNSPWGKGNLVAGKDFSDKITVDTAQFPNNVHIEWSWPSKPSSSVYGFMAVDYGDYYGTVVKTPIPSRQVKNITALTEKIDATFAGTAANYDVITDFFLTSGAGSTTTHLFEIEIFHHTPPFAADFVLRYGAVPIGKYTDIFGRAWTVTHVGNDLLFMPTNQADITVGSIDIKGMLDFLVSKGMITGKEYFNGLGVGSEPRLGSGAMHINSLSIDYR